MKIFNIPLWNGKYQDFLEIIKNPTQKSLVFTPNPEILYRAHFDQDFFEILQTATFNVPDANGLYVAEMMQEGKSFFQKKICLSKIWRTHQGFRFDA